MCVGPYGYHKTNAGKILLWLILTAETVFRDLTIGHL